jgi:double-stranded uracil-DNA glycosylase
VISIVMDATSEDLGGAVGRTIPDLVAPGLRVLFCGINPGLMSGAKGLHFARPGNRFWRVLHSAGFTDRVLDPAEQRQLLDLGLGITNLVAHTSRAAADLTPAQLREGASQLERTAARKRPAFVAVLGLQAYRTAFRRPRATIGPQGERLAGARLWLLPNPSGLQAHYGLAAMAAMYEELRVAAGGSPRHEGQSEGGPAEGPLRSTGAPAPRREVGRAQVDPQGPKSFTQS